MTKRFITTVSASQTRELGRDLAKEILVSGRKGKRAIVVALTGELGGGKTTFLQGFAKGLGIKEKILSPTFIIFRKFQVMSSKFQAFYHIDCYRIKDSKEILKLGFREIISDPENIVVIEWADIIKDIVPKEAIWIDFGFVDKKTRRILIVNKW